MLFRSLELQTEFNLFYTDVKGLDRFLDDAVSEGMLDPNICKEMQLVIREYNRIYI